MSTLQQPHLPALSSLHVYYLQEYSGYKAKFFDCSNSCFLSVALLHLMLSSPPSDVRPQMSIGLQPLSQCFWHCTCHAFAGGIDYLVVPNFWRPLQLEVLAMPQPVILQDLCPAVGTWFLSRVWPFASVLSHSSRGLVEAPWSKRQLFPLAANN